MNNVSYHQLEYECQLAYQNLGNGYHVHSSENFHVLLTSREDFETAMNIFGTVCITARRCRILAFQLMSNHFHMIVYGDIDEIKSLVELFIHLLHVYFKTIHKNVDMHMLEVKYHVIKDLNHLRNSIAYVNRNGYLVNKDYTPLTYPWGCNRFYFNEELKSLHGEVQRPSKQVERRTFTRSRRFDKTVGAMMVGNVVTPLCYCDLNAGESVFRDARHYFHTLTRNVEGFAEIAKEMEERVFYTDDELFACTMSMVRRDYHAESIGELSAHDKVSAAKRLHFDFNASNKQIIRMLRLSPDIVNDLFGQ